MMVSSGALRWHAVWLDGKYRLCGYTGLCSAINAGAD
ncbi:hypothetical protein ES702_03142 [subsurface metagenome]